MDMIEARRRQGQQRLRALLGEVRAHGPAGVRTEAAARHLGWDGRVVRRYAERLLAAGLIRRPRAGLLIPVVRPGTPPAATAPRPATGAPRAPARPVRAEPPMVPLPRADFWPQEWAPSPYVQRLLREEEERRQAEEAERQRRYDARYSDLDNAMVAAVFLGRNELIPAIDAERKRRIVEDAWARNP